MYSAKVIAPRARMRAIRASRSPGIASSLSAIRGASSARASPARYLSVRRAAESRYDESMKRKIAVSLDAALVERAEQAVRLGRSASVSAYVADALAAKGTRQDLLALLDEMDRESGPPAKEDYAWADRVLGLSSSTRARSSRSNAPIRASEQRSGEPRKRAGSLFRQGSSGRSGATGAAKLSSRAS